MSHVLCISCRKVSVGETTTAVNLSTAFATTDKRPSGSTVTHWVGKLQILK